jgi:hypothetical protein
VEAETGRATRSQSSVQGLVVSCAVLLALLVPCGAVVAWLVSGKFDRITVLAAIVAVGICWMAGTLALIVAYLGQKLASPVQGVLGGMLIRMFLPMAVGIALHRQGGPLAQTGVFTMILGVYLFALVVETLLSLRLMPPAVAITKAGPVTKTTASPSA